jgi:hypothetical protein
MSFPPRFLHSHDHLQQNPDHEHVVVDREDWIEARKALGLPSQLTEEDWNEYDFCVFLIDGTVINQEITDALFVAGCDDGTIATSGTRAWIRFTRKAESLRAAIKSAVHDIEKAKCVVVAHVEIETNTL